MTLFFGGDRYKILDTFLSVKFLEPLNHLTCYLIAPPSSSLLVLVANHENLNKGERKPYHMLVFKMETCYNSCFFFFFFFYHSLPLKSTFFYHFVQLKVCIFVLFCFVILCFYNQYPILLFFALIWHFILSHLLTVKSTSIIYLFQEQSQLNVHDPALSHDIKGQG